MDGDLNRQSRQWKLVGQAVQVFTRRITVKELIDIDKGLDEVHGKDSLFLHSF